MSDEPTFRLCDIGGRVHIGPTILKDQPDGSQMMGNRITHYDWQGNVEKVEDCYNVRLFWS